MDNTYYKVTTPIGNIWVLPQGKSLQNGFILYCKLEHTFQRDLQGYQPDKPAPEDNPNDIRPIIIRGVEYRSSFHAGGWSDGSYAPCSEWLTDGNYNIKEPKRQSSDYERRHGLRIYKVSSPILSDEASIAAKDTFIAKVMPCIAQWAKDHPQVLLEAYRDQLQEEIDRAGAEMDTLFQAYQKKNEELQAKLEKLQADLQGIK